MDRERDMQQLGATGAALPTGSAETSSPWQGFAHPDHRSEEFEPLLRTLRFALIQLNKFWVEVNAFPVFMNEMKGASITRIERLFNWLIASPNWAEAVPQPRLIPELKSPQARAALLELSESVARAAALRASMAELTQSPFPDAASLQLAQAHLGIALALSRQLGLDPEPQIQVHARIAEVGTRVGRNHRLQRFFARLASDAGLPEALNLADAGRVFQAADFVRRTKPELLAWRKPQILGPQQKVRIEAWADRARTALEARKRLQGVFKLDAGVEPERLRSIAAALRSGGTFRSFSASYKEALRQYQELLKAEPGKEAPEAMADKLADWAGYLEQKAQFEGNPEGRSFFAPQFRGIDTDFATALSAQAWASSLRNELKVEDPSAPEGHRDAAFCARLMEWVFTASDLKLHAAVALCEGEESRAAQSILLEPEYATGREFAVVGVEEESRLVEATRLRDSIAALGLRPEVPLTRLNELRLLIDERLGVIRRIEGAAEARSALKSLYAGESTDLAPVRGAQAYVDYIEQAQLPEALRNSFLAAHGPSRLADTRTMVAPALSGLVAVKDHLGRLEAATHGQSRRLEDEPLLDLIQRIQRALKHPSLLADGVEKLKSEARWKQ